MPSMAVRERPADVGSRRAREILIELGRELHRARTDHGLSQAAVAAACRSTRAQVSRIERAESPQVSIVQMTRLLAVVGLELSARAYPSGRPIRDRAHLALLARFRKKVALSVAWRFEAPVGGAGDLRAWDAVMLVGLTEVAVETETRPRDVQALLRRLATKRRDDPGISSVVLVMADTRHNRSLLKEFGEVVRAELPVASKVIIEALAAGREPGGSGIVLV
jgi:transcriptional regulator with XRE-family HTH domain